MSNRQRVMRYCLLILTGCSPATNSVAPSTPEERAVAKRIIDFANDPGSIQFVKWGPHDLGGECSGGLPTIRVVTRGKFGALAIYDEIFFFSAGKIVGSARNNGGDNWQAFAKSFGGLVPSPAFTGGIVEKAPVNPE